MGGGGGQAASVAPSFTCVGTLCRTRHIAIGTIVIQLHANKWPYILYSIVASSWICCRQPLTVFSFLTTTTVCIVCLFLPKLTLLPLLPRIVKCFKGNLIPSEPANTEGYQEETDEI